MSKRPLATQHSGDLPVTGKAARKRKPSSPELAWCDQVVALASQLHGTPEAIAIAILDTVFVRLAETRGLMDPDRSLERRVPRLFECGGNAAMLTVLTPEFTEIPLDAEGRHHVELLGHLHGVLMAPEERRGRGSHYTPREMAAEIVMHTLDPLVLSADENVPPHRHGGRPDKATAAEIANLKICDPAMGAGVFLVEAIRYLGDALHRAMEREGKAMSLHDCRVAVALRCIYGVDKDPTACWLAQCVVWLFLEEPTLSRYALLHALRCGDALVGLDQEQLCAFSLDKGQPPIPEIVQRITAGVHAAYAIRGTFRTHRLTDEAAIELNDQIDDAMDDVRFIGNLLIATFFAKDKPKAREVERKRVLALVLEWLRSDGEPATELLQMHEAFTEKLQPFHWHFEFPEAFLWPDGASLVPQQAERPLVISADARAVKVVQNGHGQMGWAL